MRRTQYSGFAEGFNCLTALEAMLVVMTVCTVLKVPFEKPALPLCPSDILATILMYTILEDITES